MLINLLKDARISFVFIAGGAAALSQPLPSVKQEATNTSCSNIVALAGNATINCSNLTAAQRKIIDNIPAVLNKIIANQLDPTAVMAKLDEIAKDVKGLRQGVYSGYDFNGAKREQSPGRFGVTVGVEANVYSRMLDLRAARQWKDLLVLADGQISKTPDWLTPYLFSGIANLGLGNQEIGISRLQYVEAEAVGKPGYAEASQILRQLGR